MLDAAPPQTCRSAAPPLAQLHGVTLARGGLRLLDGLDLAIANRPGVLALMGPNGAGKSLTLRLFAGLATPDAGRVERAAEAQDATSLVFQTPVLLRRTARANLDHALRLAGVARADRPRRLAELLALGRLEALAERPARRLSGGERQRLALVRALAPRPRLLLLDEPTASLDPQATAEIEDVIRRAAADGASVVLVTHDAGQARRLAGEVAFLHRGRLLERTPVDRFFRRPASREAAAYLDGRLLLETALDDVQPSTGRHEAT